MNRETRKANLKKLQLPSSGSGDNGGGNLRKAKTKGISLGISNFFTTPTESGNTPQIPEEPNIIERKEEISAVDITESTKISPNKSKLQKSSSFNQLEQQASASVAKSNTRTKRTKLTTFVFKDNAPATAIARKEPCADDFEAPQKKIKKAPKIKTAPAKSTKSRPNRQPNIKSAFLRNEQLFSEITAQHCLADNFSPDDLQLALAISKSEAETSGILCPTAEEDDVVDLVTDKAAAKDGDAAQASIRKKLQKYGFRTASREDYNTIAAAFLPGTNRRKKSKWANKFTALTLRNPEYQMKKVIERIETFLGEQCSTKPLTPSESHIEEYFINSATLKKFKVSILDNVVSKNEHQYSINLTEYFVKDLFNVSHVKAGHLLKNWSAIQGRDLSPQPKSSRRLLLEQKLQIVYAELEQHFMSSVKTCNKTNENNDKPSDDNDDDSVKNHSKNCGELDKFLELIADMSESNSSIKIAENEDDLLVVSGSTYNSVIEAVTSTSSSLSQEPFEKKSKLNTILAMEMPPEIDVSLSTNCTTPTALTQRTGGGTTSPDLFADSDVEMDEAQIANATQTALGITTYEIYSSDDVKTSSANEHIEISSIKAPLNNLNISENIVDLTQEEPENALKENNLSISNSKLDCISNSQQSKYNSNKDNFTLYTDSYENDALKGEAIPQLNMSTSCLNADLNSNKILTPYTSSLQPAISDITFRELTEKYLKPNNLKRKSISMTQLNKTPGDRYTMLNKSLSFTQQSNNTKTRNDLDKLLLSSPRSNANTDFDINLNSPFKCISADANFDLSQNEEDECLMLSDDEINYSIWKANQTINFKDQSKLPIETQDLTLNSDSEQENSEKETASKISNQHDYFFLDLIDANKSLHEGAVNLRRTTSNLSFDGDVELISSQFLTTPKKYANSSPSKRNDLIKERAEFGIIESYSEELFNTQSSTFKTPTKPPSVAVDDELANASFLQSPEQYAVLKIKRYSTSSQKFNALLQSVVQNEIKTTHKDDDDDFDELDEFDKLVFNRTPTETKSSSNLKQPNGLDQLLNAEISFREEEIVDYRSPKKLYISPRKNKSNIEQKSATKQTETNKQEEELHMNGRVYRVRVTTSTKPDFTKLSEAELLKQLYNFGIKPLKRKQAVKILEYIYNQTHPLIIADNEQEHGEKPTTSIYNKNSGAADCASKPTNDISQQTTQLNVISSAPASQKLNLRDCFGDVLMRFSHELCAELCEGHEEYVFQTNITKKVPQPLLPLHIAWYNLVCGNSTLHETILMFEPVDLQEIYLFLKGLGYRYDPKDLKIFFDRRCIIFRYDLTAPNGGGAPTANNRHVRKRKKNVVNRVV